MVPVKTLRFNFLLPADFFQDFTKNVQEHYLTVKPSVLDWVQTVCTGYQQTTKVASDFNFNDFSRTLNDDPRVLKGQ